MGWRADTIDWNFCKSSLRSKRGKVSVLGLGQFAKEPDSQLGELWVIDVIGHAQQLATSCLRYGAFEGLKQCGIGHGIVERLTGCVQR
jgi:hypothetical protein